MSTRANDLVLGASITERSDIAIPTTTQDLGGDRRRHREAQLSQVRAFFFGDCSFFFIDCFDRIVSQFLQLCQEYTSPAFDSLSCLVKNLVRAGGHGGYLRRGRLCLCQGGFCQCAGSYIGAIDAPLPRMMIA